MEVLNLQLSCIVDVCFILLNNIHELQIAVTNYVGLFSTNTFWITTVAYTTYFHPHVSPSVPNCVAVLHFSP